MSAFDSQASSDQHKFADLIRRALKTKPISNEEIERRSKLARKSGRGRH
jgi:hypothetical protein